MFFLNQIMKFPSQSFISTCWWSVNFEYHRHILSFAASAKQNFTHGGEGGSGRWASATEKHLAFC